MAAPIVKPIAKPIIVVFSYQLLVKIVCLKIQRVQNMNISEKQGNRHPRAWRGGVVPAGVNHRAPDLVAFGQLSRFAAFRPLARLATSWLLGF